MEIIAIWLFPQIDISPNHDDVKWFISRAPLILLPNSSSLVDCTTERWLRARGRWAFFQRCSGNFEPLSIQILITSGKWNDVTCSCKTVVINLFKPKIPDLSLGEGKIYLLKHWEKKHSPDFTSNVRPFVWLIVCELHWLWSNFQIDATKKTLQLAYQT